MQINLGLERFGLVQNNPPFDNMQKIIAFAPIVCYENVNMV